MQDRTALLIGRRRRAPAACRVAVVGLGGVGGHCAEALARAGVGALHLVDADAVTESNLNRQLVATFDTIGRKKTEAMAERLAAVSRCRVTAADVFVLPDTVEQALPARLTFSWTRSTRWPASSRSSIFAVPAACPWCRAWARATGWTPPALPCGTCLPRPAARLRGDARGAAQARRAVPAGRLFRRAAACRAGAGGHRQPRAGHGRRGVDRGGLRHPDPVGRARRVVRRFFCRLRKKAIP